MKIFLFFAVLFFSFSLSAAGYLYCRSGIVLAAEVTTADIKITNFTGHGFRLPVPDKRGYAAITIKPNDMRAVSIFDYSLEISSISFPCVAIWNGSKFEYSTKDIQSSNPVQLLFIIDKEMIIGDKILNTVFKSNFVQGSNAYSITLPATIIGKKMPTVPNKIPAAGIWELPEK